LRGKTAKSIGLVLGINHRTVTSHLDHVKQKLNCSFKSELIDYVLNQTNFLRVIKPV